MSTTKTANKATQRATVAFRTDRGTRLRLEAIQHDKGHVLLSETLREAVTEYIERHSSKAAQSTDHVPEGAA